MSTQFTDKVIHIDITQKSNGLLKAETNTHVVDDVKLSELEYIYMPYAGTECEVKVTCKQQPQIAEAVKQKLLEGINLRHLLEADNPVLNNMFSNIKNSYLDGSIHINHLASRLDANQTVIFVGAGPSLTKPVLNLLQHIIDADKALVIACGSANRILDNAGICPHFALAFDPHESEYEAIGSISKDYTNNVPLICTTGLEKRCFNLPWKAKFVAPSFTFPLLGAYLEPDACFIDEGCSGVMTMAVNLLRYLGSTQMVLVGVDLSYSEDRRLYADSESPIDESAVFEYKGHATREIWVREAHYIINRGKELGIEVFTATPSLLNEIGATKLNMRRLAEDAPTYCITSYINGVLEAAKPKQGSVKMKLQGLFMDACMIENVGSLDSAAMKTDLYKKLLRSWDMMQQFREVRGHQYNNYMMMALVRNIRDELSDMD